MKQEIQDKITENRACRENSNFSLNFYKERVDFYDKDLIELKKQLKECDELKLLKSGHGFNGDVNRYKSHELMMIAMNNSNTRNKLEAYSRVIDPDWRENKQSDYYISTNGSRFNVGYHHNYKNLGSVYMSEKAAIRIAEALNNKEITI